jgi:predicted GIY-YIG superfamily endonuclease
MSDDRKYYVYWIVSGRSNYVGATVCPTNRLKQHCGLKAGGAKRTRGKLWTYKCVVSGFRTWSEALKCEWSVKYHSKKCRGIESRRIALEKVLKMERWTSTSPLSSEVPLTVEYDPTKYGMPPENLPSPLKKVVTIHKTKKKSWKKTLHGVTY